MGSYFWYWESLSGLSPVVALSLGCHINRGLELEKILVATLKVGDLFCEEDNGLFEVLEIVPDGDERNWCNPGQGPVILARCYFSLDEEMKYDALIMFGPGLKVWILSRGGAG